jgi:hypothetical protein
LRAGICGDFSYGHWASQIRPQSWKHFAFLMLPLDHRIPDLLVRSIVWPNGKMNPGILRMKKDLCQALRSCGFIPSFVATDRDNGMDAEHNRVFELYKNLHCSLNEIVRYLSEHGHMKEWSISDLLHLMKNARARIPLFLLASNASARVINGHRVTESLKGTKTTREFQGRKPLDLLKDDLAIRAFTLETFWLSSSSMTPVEVISRCRLLP